MAALLGDDAAVDEQNAVAEARRGKAVRDEHARPPHGHGGVFLIDIVLGNGVERGGRLVEQQDGRVLIERSGEHEPLHFAAGEQHAVLEHLSADVRFEIVRQRRHALREPRLFETFAHARLVDALARLRNVFLQRRFEHRELLEHGGEERVVLLPVELPDVLAV